MIDAHRQLRDFVDLVIELRSAQKRYFKSVPGTLEKRRALDESMALEQKVDRAAADIKAPSLEL